MKLKKKTPCVGFEALRKIKDAGPARQLRGFVVDGGRVARDGMAVFAGERQVGTVTSGAPSPTLGKNIMMALLASEAADDETLTVDIRGRRARLWAWLRTRVRPWLWAPWQSCRLPIRWSAARFDTCAATVCATTTRYLRPPADNNDRGSRTSRTDASSDQQTSASRYKWKLLRT